MRKRLAGAGNTTTRRRSGPALLPEVQRRGDPDRNAKRTAAAEEAKAEESTASSSQEGAASEQAEGEKEGASEGEKSGGAE
jgi:hypothetical protein